MYILFINSGGKWGIFFSQFNNNNNNNKNYATHGSNLTQLDPCGLGWFEPLWWVKLGLIFFFLTMMGWVKKSSQFDPTWFMHTLRPTYQIFGVVGNGILNILFNDKRLLNEGFCLSSLKHTY